MLLQHGEEADALFRFIVRADDRFCHERRELPGREPRRLGSLLSSGSRYGGCP
jgi:hypothetical protein